MASWHADRRPPSRRKKRGYLDAEPIREAIRRANRQGVSFESIAERAGIHYRRLHAIIHEQQYVTDRVADNVLTAGLARPDLYANLTEEEAA